MAMSTFDKNQQRMRALNQTQTLLAQGHTTPSNPIPFKNGGLKDMLGNKFQLRDRVVRSVRIGNSNGLRICEVTKLDYYQSGHVALYLDHSTRPVARPELLLILK